MPPLPQSEQNASGMGPIWVIVGIGLLIVGIWYFAHAYIIYGYFHVKLFEISLIQFFIHALGSVRAFIENSTFESVTFNQTVGVAQAVGNYIKYPCAVLLLILALLLFFKGTAYKFRRTYNMQSLLEVDVKTWPQEIPVLKHDLVNTDIDTGPWAMAMTPMYFAKHYKLLQEKKVDKKEDQLSREVSIHVTVIKSRATHLFALQLGKLWKGAELLDDHVKALFAAFSARVGRDTQKSLSLLQNISRSAGNGSLDFSGVDELFKKHHDNPLIVELTKKHAYVYTVMVALLERARDDGVVSCADFLWLKPLDRRLWFVLNSVGRQTCVVEAAGPMAHFLAEKEAGRRIRTPMIDQAVKAFDEAIQEIKYNPNTNY